MKKLLVPFFITVVLVILIFIVFGSIETSVVVILEDMKLHPETFSIYSFLILTSDIVLPVPSSIIMVMNGYVLGTFSGAILSLISLFISSAIGYQIGRIAGFRKSKIQQGKAENLLGIYGPYAILITRGIPVLSESICIVCGYNRMNLKSYLIMNIIGYIPLCFIYARAGQSGDEQNAFLLVVGLSFILTIILWLVGRWLPGTNMNSSEKI